jgi:hypothetical protein
MIWIIMSGAGHHHTAILCGPRNQPVSQIKGTVWGCRGADGESHGGRQFESDSEIVSGQESQFPGRTGYII